MTPALPALLPPSDDASQPDCVTEVAVAPATGSAFELGELQLGDEPDSSDA